MLGTIIFSPIQSGQAMYRLISRLHVPYILMSQQPTLNKMLMNFAQQVQQLRDFGACDIILDPGFGFGKTLEQNYEIMNEMERLHVMELPLLVGISRKSMIRKLLGPEADPENGTTVLNTLAMQHGADYLRVHHVKNAVDLKKTLIFANQSE